MRRGSPNSIGRSSRWRTGTFFLSQARTSRWKASSSGEYERSMARSVARSARALLPVADRRRRLSEEDARQLAPVAVRQLVPWPEDLEQVEHRLPRRVVGEVRVAA